jgi:hypothetical protein
LVINAGQLVAVTAGIVAPEKQQEEYNKPEYSVVICEKILNFVQDNDYESFMATTNNMMQNL